MTFFERYFELLDGPEHPLPRHRTDESGFIQGARYGHRAHPDVACDIMNLHQHRAAFGKKFGGVVVWPGSPLRERDALALIARPDGVAQPWLS